MIERYAAMLAADKADAERQTAVRNILQEINKMTVSGRISDEDIARLKTVADLRRLIETAVG